MAGVQEAFLPAGPREKRLTVDMVLSAFCASLIPGRKVMSKMTKGKADKEV